MINQINRILEFNQTSVKQLPQTPGIYVYFDLNKNPLYVGKSKNLRSRVSSYLLRNITGKTKIMVNQIKYFTYVLVNTELESLLLETDLIRKFQTKYNLVLKDDKTPLYIAITKEKYPLVIAIRKSQIGSLNRPFLAGPFLSSTIVKKVLKDIRRVFPYAQHKIEKKPCIYNQIGQCSPCPNGIERIKDLIIKEKETRKYKKNISYIKSVLRGKSSILLNKFKAGLIKASARQDYESALKFKRMVDGLNYLTQPIYESADYVENPNLSEDINLTQLDSLKSVLNQNGINIVNLDIIECYDISHISGAFPTASLVTLRNGAIDKNLYKRFRIKKQVSNDDTGSLREVASRRLKHLIDLPAQAGWGRPDLIIVDGGKGQVSAFYEQFAKESIPVVGIAKKYEMLIIPQVSPFNKKIVSFSQIKLKNPALFLVQKIRDEAHRFAKAYHNKLLRKSLYNKDK